MSWFLGTKKGEVDERVKREESLRQERRLRIEEAERREQEINTALEQEDEDRLSELRRRLRIYGGA